MGNEVEASAECVCDHLQRPDHPDRQLTNAKVRSAVNQTVPLRAVKRPGSGGGSGYWISTRGWSVRFVA